MFKPNVQYTSHAICLDVAGICPATSQSPTCAPSTDALRA